MGRMVEVTDATFGPEVEQSSGLVVVDFTAAWCGPCRVIAPVLEQLAEEYQGKATFAKLDIDHNLKTTARFNVRSAPTLLFFKDGEPVAQIVGAVPRARIEAALQQHA